MYFQLNDESQETLAFSSLEEKKKFTKFTLVTLVSIIPHNVFKIES